MKTNQDMQIQEVFKQFCKERHAEDKGRNYNTLQEIYANTELFDLSLMKVDFGEGSTVGISVYPMLNECRVLGEFKDLTLPFASVFLLLSGDDSAFLTSIFVREYSPTILTGTVRTEIKFNMPSIRSTKGSVINTPFTVNTETGDIVLDTKGWYDFIAYSLGENPKQALFKDSKLRKATEEAIKRCYLIVKSNLNLIANLPKHSVAVSNSNKSEYYTRKRASTLKVNRPIYYVLNKEQEGNLDYMKKIRACGEVHFDHSFKVRSHWRKLHNPNTLGKNRNGEYVVKGMTFVREAVKGTGELARRLRIVK